nr:DNA circularization N-terminal domain-containing protein [Candidatus Hamiltonella defensa]
MQRCPLCRSWGKSSFGRKTAVHEYPYRDKPWVEDLGRATRQLTVKGFLVEDSVIYGGGAVIDQRSNLIAACETAGAGTLIHPTYGELTVSIPSGGLKIVEQWDNGRYFEFTLRAIESGLKVFPVTTSTPLPDEESWLKSIATTTLQFVTTVNSILRKSPALIQTLQSTAVFWVSQVTGTLNQANNLINTMTDVFDSNHYGRFQSSGNSGLASHQTYPVLMQKQKAASAQNRGKVATVGDELTQSVDAETYAGVANALLSAVVLSVSEPQDQIRIFIHLSVFETGNDVPGVDDAVQDAALASAQDPEKRRHRKKIDIIESTMIANGVAQQYIDWEMNRRYGRSKALQVVVDSWRDKSGKLWEINTQIPISIPVFNITDMYWLLSEVTFTRDQRGTTAELVLMPPEAFTVEPYQFYQQVRELND